MLHRQPLDRRFDMSAIRLHYEFGRYLRAALSEPIDPLFGVEFDFRFMIGHVGIVQ